MGKLINESKGNAQEGLRKWFEAWESEIREAWKATEEDGSWNAYENIYRDWEQNYKEWCVMGNWEQVENFKKEIDKIIDYINEFSSGNQLDIAMKEHCKNCNKQETLYCEAYCRYGMV